MHPARKGRVFDYFRLYVNGWGRVQIEKILIVSVLPLRHGFFQHPEVMPQQVRGIIADFTVGLHKIKQGKLAQKWKDFT
jgi:hypothetical protein